MLDECKISNLTQKTRPLHYQSDKRNRPAAYLWLHPALTLYHVTWERDTYTFLKNTARKKKRPRIFPCTWVIFAQISKQTHRHTRCTDVHSYGKKEKKFYFVRWNATCSFISTSFLNKQLFSLIHCFTLVLMWRVFVKAIHWVRPWNGGTRRERAEDKAAASLVCP